MLDLISEIGLSGSNPVMTPLEVNKKLTIVEYDVALGVLDNTELVDLMVYQKLIGKLI